MTYTQGCVRRAIPAFRMPDCGGFSLVSEESMAAAKPTRIRSTTVICVRRNGQVVMAADGQVTLGDHVLKHSAKKIAASYQGQDSGWIRRFYCRRFFRLFRGLNPSWSSTQGI